MFGCFGLQLFTGRIVRLTAGIRFFGVPVRIGSPLECFYISFMLFLFIVQIIAVLYNLYCMK